MEGFALPGHKYRIAATLDGYHDKAVEFSNIKPTRNIPAEVFLKLEPLAVPPSLADTSQTTQPNLSGNVPSRWAVVIGISRYEAGGPGNLAYANEDAQAFHDALLKQGWDAEHIRLLVNEQATKRNIEIALEGWLSKARPEDMIVLFWAGHGLPDPYDSEKVYLASYDTHVGVELPGTGVRMDRLMDSLKERNVRNTLVFADTCYAGRLGLRSDRGIGVTPIIREKSIPKGWICMTGAESDRKAVEDSKWAHGAFTYVLLGGLAGEADGFESAGLKDGVVTMGELKAYLQTKMPDETQRALGSAIHPDIRTSSGDPDIWNLSLKGN